MSASETNQTVKLDENITAEERNRRLEIRIERMRERADTLARLVESIDAATEQRIAEIQREAERAIAAAQQRCDDGLKKMQGDRKHTDREMTNAVARAEYDGMVAGRKLGFDHCYDVYINEIRAGERELERRKRDRRRRFVDKCLGENVLDLPLWARSQIREDLGESNHVPVTILHKKRGKKPPVIGKRGYYTTPSGKTLVKYPSAYSWPTVYHCSTRKIVVGETWLKRNARKLATNYAARTINR